MLNANQSWPSHAWMLLTVLSLNGNHLPINGTVSGSSLALSFCYQSKFYPRMAGNQNETTCVTVLYVKQLQMSYCSIGVFHTTNYQYPSIQQALRYLVHTAHSCYSIISCNTQIPSLPQQYQRLRDNQSILQTT